MLCSVRGPAIETRSPLACGLALRYSPEVSSPDATGRRHKVLPLSFRADVGDGRSVPLCDPSGREIGRVQVVEVPAGLRVEVLDADLLKRITKGKLPTGLAAKWTADRSTIERGTLVTITGTLHAVTLTDQPGYDHCELATMR